jgi:hypothetical protein
MPNKKNCSGKPSYVVPMNAVDASELYAFIMNHIASATITTTITPQTTGVTFFELPLRGESLGA